LQHIKAIITAQEVLVRDPMDDDVVSVVEELRRRLPVKVSGQGQGEEESCAEDSEENGKIFVLFCFCNYLLAFFIC
jgi:magnesium transporter